MLDNLKYHRGIIKRIINHTGKVKSFELEVDGLGNINPGQFIMVWVLGYEEIPISPSKYSNNMVRLTIMNRGETTNRIHRMREGDKLYLRGPYGNGFDLSRGGRYLLVGGGYGSAPIIYAAHILHEKGFKVTYVEGVKSIRDSLFIKEAEDIGIENILVTEDGSSGIKGLVTSYVENIAKEYDYILGCGPEEMLIKLLDICLRNNVECQLSFERMIKCGVGICGSCELNDSGLLICRDGPIFNNKKLLEIGFGGVYHG